MFAADTNVYRGLLVAGIRNRIGDKSSNRNLIKYFERVVVNEAKRSVSRQQSSLHVITTESEGHLSEVIGSERKEIGILSDLTRLTNSLILRAAFDLGMSYKSSMRFFLSLSIKSANSV